MSYADGAIATDQHAAGVTSRPWEATFHEIGRAVRDDRILCGLTQEELAECAGVSQGAVSRLEGGRGLNAPHRVVVAIQEALRKQLAAIGVSRPDPPDAPRRNALLRRMLRAYQDASPALRPALVTLVEAVASGAVKSGGVAAVSTTDIVA